MRAFKLPFTPFHAQGWQMKHTTLPLCYASRSMSATHTQNRALPRMHGARGCMSARTRRGILTPPSRGAKTGRARSGRASERKPLVLPKLRGGGARNDLNHLVRRRRLRERSHQHLRDLRRARGGGGGGRGKGAAVRGRSGRRADGTAAIGARSPPRTHQPRALLPAPHHPRPRPLTVSRDTTLPGSESRPNRVSSGATIRLPT